MKTPTMSEAFARYCQLYVPDAGALDAIDFARLKGAFSAGLTLGCTISMLGTREASETVDRWTQEIEEFWKEPPP